jgi:PAS domain S-box-containing protein
MQSMVDQTDALSLEAMQSGRVVVTRAGGRRIPSGITATINRGQQVFGVLTARSWKPRPFTATEVQFVGDAATLIGRMLTRKESERKLRESEERFRLLAERSPDIVVLTRMVPEIKLEYISPSIEKVVGYTPDEVLHAEDRARIWAIVHPEDREQSRRYIENPISTTQPLVVRWIHKDGSVVWTEQRMTPIFENGVLVAIEGVIRDVTHRVLSQQRRQAQADVTQLILEGRPANEILQAAAGHLSRLSGSDHALLALPASARPGWSLRTIGPDAQTVNEIALPSNDPLMARVSAGTAPVMIEDLLSELPVNHALRALDWSGSALLAPIRGSDGPLGVLGIANVAPGRGFSELVKAALGEFASQAALAIEYGRAREELQRLAVLEDRARISRELHDGVIQSLFGAGMMLEAIRETEDVSPPTRDGIARVAQMIDNTMVDVRSYIFDLRPSALTGRSIEQGLRLLADDFEKASSIPCSVDMDTEALRGLEGAAPQLIQIVREALSNVARHSRASSCSLEVHRSGRDILVEIRDDGRGFTTARASGGRGLENIRRRTDEIGARVELISEPGKGSIVRVRIPTTRALSSKRTTYPRTAAAAKVEG